MQAAVPLEDLLRCDPEEPGGAKLNVVKLGKEITGLG